MSTRTQLRGHCQACGRLHAVPTRLAKHGYTVKNGWFQGTCPGSDHAPMEESRELTDKIAAGLRETAASLRAQAKKLREGWTPSEVMRKRRLAGGNTEVYVVAWSDLKPWEKSNEIDTLVWQAESGADARERGASELQRMATLVYGQPLITAKVEAPSPIRFGERRVLDNGRVATVTTTGQRIYWKDDLGFKSWTGAAAWRKLPLAT